MGRPLERSFSLTLRGYHVLVIDDDRDARHILDAVLSHHGALVTTAATVERGLAQVRAARPDVVVSDMLLGVSNGLALVAHVQGVLRGVPLIAVSAADFDPRQLEFIGFAAYLRKPLRHLELVATIVAVVQATADATRTRAARARRRKTRA